MILKEPSFVDKGRASNPMVEIRKLDQIGMIAIRGETESPELRDAMKLIGGAVPGKCEIIGSPDLLAAWMAPDEILVMLPEEQVRDAADKLESALQDEHFLCIDVSDMRSCVEVSGDGSRDLLAKGTPADVSPEAFRIGQIRRSLFAQIQAAFWLAGEHTVRLLCRRSETDHMLTWLREMAPREGSQLYFEPK